MTELSAELKIDLSDALKSVDELSDRIGRLFDAPIALRIDNAAALRTIDLTRRRLSTISDTVIGVDTDVDDSGIDDLEARVGQVDGASVDVVASVDEGDLIDFEFRVMSLGNTSIGLKALIDSTDLGQFEQSIAGLSNLTVEIETALATGDIEAAEQLLATLDGSAVEVTTNVFTGEVASLEDQLGQLEGFIVDITTAVADGDVDAVAAKLSSLDGTSLAVAVEVDDSSLSDITETAGGLSGILGSVPIAGAAAAAGIGLVTAGLGAAVSAAADFDGGIREITSLNPTELGIGETTDLVKELVVSTGIASSEVIPALYGAISAGVSEDNAFSFISNASELAIAGVTDLDTSVALIQGTINAYGETAIDADEASRLLFSTVQGGSTNMEELGSQLGQITPSAAALGVQFDELNALVATSTQVTGNTAQSVTGLRGVFTEFATETSKVSQAFEELSGQSIAEFTVAGGTATEVFRSLLDSVGGNEIAFRSLFSSSEAAGAALGVIRNNLGPLNESLAATQEALSGASEVTAAFDNANEGFGRQLESVRAQFGLVGVELGSAIIPALEVLLKVVEDSIPAIREFVGTLEPEDIVAFAEGAVELGEQVFGVVQELAPLGSLLLDIAGVLSLSIGPALDELSIKLEVANLGFGLLGDAARIAGDFLGFNDSVADAAVALSAAAAESDELGRSLDGIDLADFPNELEVQLDFAFSDPEEIQRQLADLDFPTELEVVARAEVQIETQASNTPFADLSRDLIQQFNGGALDSLDGLELTFIEGIRETQPRITQAYLETFGDLPAEELAELFTEGIPDISQQFGSAMRDGFASQRESINESILEATSLDGALEELRGGFETLQEFLEVERLRFDIVSQLERSGFDDAAVFAREAGTEIIEELDAALSSGDLSAIEEIEDQFDAIRDTQLEINALVEDSLVQEFRRDLEEDPTIIATRFGVPELDFPNLDVPVIADTTQANEAITALEQRQGSAILNIEAISQDAIEVLDELEETERTALLEIAANPASALEILEGLDREERDAILRIVPDSFASQRELARLDRSSADAVVRFVADTSAVDNVNIPNITRTVTFNPVLGPGGNSLNLQFDGGIIGANGLALMHDGGALSATGIAKATPGGVPFMVNGTPGLMAENGGDELFINEKSSMKRVIELVESFAGGKIARNLEAHYFGKFASRLGNTVGNVGATPSSVPAAAPVTHEWHITSPVQDTVQLARELQRLQIAREAKVGS